MATTTRKVRSDNTQLGILSGSGCRAQRFVGSGTFQVGKAGSVLVRIIIGTTAASALRIRDGSEVKTALKASMAEGSYDLGYICNDQPYLDLDGASDVTMVWAP